MMPSLFQYFDPPYSLLSQNLIYLHFPIFYISTSRFIIQKVGRHTYYLFHLSCHTLSHFHIIPFPFKAWHYMWMASMVSIYGKEKKFLIYRWKTKSNFNVKKKKTKLNVKYKLYFINLNFLRFNLDGRKIRC